MYKDYIVSDSKLFWSSIYAKQYTNVAKVNQFPDKDEPADQIMNLVLWARYLPGSFRRRRGANIA